MMEGNPCISEKCDEKPLIVKNVALCSFSALSPFTNIKLQCSEARVQRLLCERYLGGLKGAPILFTRNIVARANKTEHI